MISFKAIIINLTILVDFSVTFPSLPKTGFSGQVLIWFIQKFGKYWFCRKFITKKHDFVQGQYFKFDHFCSLFHYFSQPLVQKILLKIGFSGQILIGFITTMAPLLSLPLSWTHKLAVRAASQRPSVFNRGRAELYEKTDPQSMNAVLKHSLNLSCNITSPNNIVLSMETAFK